MNFEINKNYYGFKLLEEKKIDDISSTVRLFSHEKSGAKLVSIENSDDNKVFSISFKTLPDNSTGVFHILEHSVLCGSRKFPSKEPFVELVKGSLNTYLNAATYPDKTMYPVASKNDKDFRNLMDVYLDAVFYPNIYKYPEIMKQEGWHYEINNKEDELKYKGVVYNEMQGVYSSPESLLFRGINSNLFPDTPYGFDSGGDPDEIPELTQEQFLNYHKKFYHPSNSYIYLYGDMNIEEDLKFIDENYLSNFDKVDLSIEIPAQKPFEEMKEKFTNYPIANEESEVDKTYLSLNFTIGDVKDRELYLAFDLLEDMLLETSASPLKKALIDSAIAKDVFGIYNNGSLQTSLSIIVKNSNEDKKEKFKSVVFETLQDIVKNGFDKNLIEAVLNAKEFELKESDYSSYPKGLVYCEKVLGSLLYGGSPFQNLEFNEVLNRIKNNVHNGYFEKLIEDHILNNNNSLLFMVIPQKHLAEEKIKEDREKLQNYKKSLTKEEIEKLIEENSILVKRQSSPDSQEDLEKIPLLSIEDVKKNLDTYNTIVKDLDTYKILYTELVTNGIDYIDFYFDTSYVNQEQIPYITLLSYLLGRVDTEKYSYEELSNEVNKNTGGIDFDAEAYSNLDKIEEYYPKFIIKGKALHTKSESLLNLIFEIINSSKFDNHKRIKEILSELKSRIEMIIVSGGHRIASSKVTSYYSQLGEYLETINGFTFYKFLVEVEKNFDDKKDQFIKNLLEVSESIFTTNNLIVNLGSSKEDYNELSNNIENIISSKLKVNNNEKIQYKFELKKENEALVTSSKVQYVAKGYNFSKFGFKYSGKLQVLRTISNYDYLWNNVRVKGGAYGVFINFRRNGNMNITSYRDPNLSETIEVYDNFYKYIENFSADEREMTKYILGTISTLDTPLTNSMICDRQAVLYISNIDDDFLQREREEILKTKVEDIKKFAALIDKCMRENYICVLGGKDKINQNSNIFGSIVNVFN
ncbi:insulinase family protein [Clostridium pasteurianum]|uniref:Putative Zn-dependent peptidase, insulinase n=1 Tax=Clostridium pasteurianum BC1 TaxID=86416 RepID=R4K2C8_CLOPA|nr:insulinase family protein [Clostridium pasteurianum]AGK97257.1 putative Zn-dependent peptidase, insulinase [Clostridium pasteurianum BC1]